MNTEQKPQLTDAVIQYKIPAFFDLNIIYQTWVKKMDGSIGKFKKKQIQHTRRHYLILAAIIAFALLHPGNHATLAQENDQPVPAENTEQQPPSSDEQESTGGYPIKKRRIGGPTDVEWDLDNSFPKRDSVLELILRCSESQEN